MMDFKEFTTRAEQDIRAALEDASPGVGVGLNRANCLYLPSLHEKRNNFKVGKPGEIRRRKAIGPVKWQPVASYRVVSDCQACIGLTVLFSGGDNHDLYYIKHPIDEDGFPPA